MSDSPPKSQSSILARLPVMPPRPGSRPRMPAVGREEAARHRMTQRLAALRVDPADMPPVDPRTAAVAGLMVANFVSQEPVRKRFGALVGAKLFDFATLDDLPVAARFVLRILPKLGAELHERDSAAIPAELAAEAQAKHTEMMRLVERHLSDVDEAHGRIVTIRLGQGYADLVHDLRMLASLWRDYADTLEAEAGSAYRRDARREARVLALRLETAMLEPISEEEREWRSYLQRALGVLVPLYEDVCLAGRFLFHNEKPEARFPTFASVARVRRRLAREVERKSESRQSGIAAAAMPPSSRGRPDLPSFPEVSLIDVNEHDEQVFAGALEAVPPNTAPSPSMMPPGASRPPSGSAMPILDVVKLDFSPAAVAGEDADADLGTPELDLELTYTSESNFYADVALTNVGVFVATFVVKPPGTPITMRLALPQMEHPITLTGTVAWVREFSPSIEAPPGIGLALRTLAPEHKRAVDAFMKVRPPILHDD